MSHKSLMLLTAAALTLMLTTTTTSAARHHAALAMSAIYHMALNQNGWVDDPEAARQKAIWFVRRAVRHAGTDPRTLALAAWALAYAGDDIDAAIALMDQSLHINPSFAESMAMERAVEIVGGFSGYGDRSSREIVAARSARSCTRDIVANWRGPFLRAAPGPGADYVVAVIS